MKVTDGLDVGVDKLKALNVGLGGSIFGHGVSSSTPMLSVPALPCLADV